MVPTLFRRMLLERSAEHQINPINTARRVGAVLREWLLKPCEKQGVGRGEHRCIERQMQNAGNLDSYGFKCGCLLGLSRPRCHPR